MVVCIFVSYASRQRGLLLRSYFTCLKIFRSCDCFYLWLQESQVTLSLTNPVENLLKVTLLKFEEESKDTAGENDTQDKENKSDQNTDKNDVKTENEEKKEDEEGKDKNEDDKKGEGKTKEKSDAEQGKDAEKDKKKDSSVGVTVVIQKPNRSMDNSCESRCFVSTAEVNLDIL